ncbi:Imm1 family immunity protein [Actinomadura geliboluensis]|uniref:Imm1 family immunity protein n=1 Tax=Actinomadura geliboluensis TaxID=882440 RepID=UPI0036888640
MVEVRNRSDDWEVEMLLLSAFFGKKWHYADSREEISRLIDEMMASLKGEEGGGHVYSPGNDAWLCLAGRRSTDQSPVSSSNLRVSVNWRTKYGALIWFVDEQFPAKGGIYDSVWISDNPEPLDCDPRVVSDPGYPLFHDLASALPVSQVRWAVEEFCYERSGARPDCIRWVSGQMNGQRLDRPSIVQFVEDPEIDWSELR